MIDIVFCEKCAKLCMPSCEETEYSYQIDTTDLNSERLCQDESLKEVSDSLVIVFVIVIVIVM
jgi:hypothetical protein